MNTFRTYKDKDGNLQIETYTGSLAGCLVFTGSSKLEDLQNLSDEEKEEIQKIKLRK